MESGMVPFLAGGGRRGSILLVAIGVLAVLSILAIAFANLMHVESWVASSRVDRVRAEMAAESGFEEALQILRETVLLRPWSDPKDRWVFRNQTASDVGTGIPIEEAVNPSIRGGAYPAGHPLAGKGYTRFLPSPDSVREVSVTVKIESNAGKIDLSGGELGGPPDQGYNAQLARFLDDLVYALKQDPAYRSANLPDDAGRRILAGRPAGGFQSVTELAGILGDRGAQELADFVTAHAWADPSTIRPDPMPLDVTWGQDPVRTRPFALEAEPRAPIDMNLASRPVLIASLMGLSARVLERRSEPRAAGAKNGYAWRVVETPAIDYALARDVADSLLLRRESAGPFRTWDEFDSWLLALEPSLASLTPEGVDVIRAAVNPNTRLAKKNPDRVLLRSIDKSDLVLRKTEWTFGPTGSFRIQSLGRVVLAGELVAQARLTVDYRLLATRRHTTQADFAAAQVYADDDVLLLPESIPDSDRKATEDGQISLAPAPNAGDDASLSFRVPWRTGLDADIGNPKTPLAAPSTTIEDSPPSTVVGPGQADPSNLLPDGVTFDMTSGELYMFDAATNRPWIEGALEFWFKPDHNWDLVREYKEPGSVGLIQILQPLADRKTTLVHQVKIVLYDDRDRPEIFSRLRIYTTKRVAAPEIGGFAPIPPGYDYKTELTYRYTTWFPKTDPAKPMSNNGLTRDHGLDWRQGIWHHVAIRWTNPTEHVMWIDGCAMKPLLWGKGVYDPSSSYLWNGTQMVSHFQIGCRRIEQYGIGGAIDLEETFGLGTHARLRVYRDPGRIDTLFPLDGTGQPMDLPAPPELYLPPGGLSGVFRGEFRLPAGSVLAGVAWTEHRPREAYEIYDYFNMAGRVYSIEGRPDRPDIKVRLRKDSASPYQDVAGDGEGAGLSTASTDGGVTYEIAIDDMNFQPLSVAPVLDDVTITWLDPAILSWRME